ncbi:MAG: DUF6531 domain-containing protein [Clostridiales Family XIII bacterium]|jgi:RHS repeat-associated protein|nr:DUF6531 domain-containing protein [Clostridiales Family XIII bacterium]
MMRGANAGLARQLARAGRIVSVWAQAIGILLALAAVSAMGVGLLTDLLAHFPGGGWSEERIRATASVAAYILSVASASVFFHVAFIGLGSEAGANARERFARARRTVKAFWPKVLIRVVALTAAGRLVSFVFDRFSPAPRELPIEALEYALLAALGAVALYLIRRLYRAGGTRADGGGIGRKASTSARARACAEPALCLPILSHARLSYRLICVALVCALLFGSASALPAHAAGDAFSVHAADEEAASAGSWEIAEDAANTYEEAEILSEQIASPLKAPAPEGGQDKPEGAIRETTHDRYSRTYLNADGTYTTRIQNEPLTYTDETGNERDIDNTLVFAEDGFTNKANAYGVALPREGEGVSFEKDGCTLTVTPLFGTLGGAVVRDNAVYYNDVAPGTDLQYRVHGAEVKEDIILNRPVANRSFDYALSSPDVTFVLEDNRIKGFAESAEADPDAQPVFVIDAPLMTDASGKFSADISLELDASGGAPVMRIVPDAAWLAAPERAYPVVIDPSHALSGDNLTQGTVQAFSGNASGPNMEHSVSYLYVGLEKGNLVGVEDIVYGESWSYVRINDIAPYIADLPERSILSATLSAYKYAEESGATGRVVDAKMIAADWGGNGRRTWNNRPRGAGLTWLDGETVPAGKAWMHFDITEAFKVWKNDPASNRGIMFTPQDESQPAICFSGTGNEHAQAALYIDLSWTVPKPVDENLALNAPNINLRPLTYKNAGGIQNFVGLFADGLARPALQIDYAMNLKNGDALTPVGSGTYAKAEYEPDYPDSGSFEGLLEFTLGYNGLYESNWQTGLMFGSAFSLDTLYQMSAQGTRVHDVWANPGGVAEQTPVGLSDTFIAYQFQRQDTLPYVAAYYGVSRDTIARDNRIGDDLAMPGNTFFIRNPNANATIPYTRPENPDLAHKRALIYANMGRSQVSEFDMEPVNMNTGNFYLEQTDAVSHEYGVPFEWTRSYNALAPQSAGPFGRGWTTAFQQTLTGGEDGGMIYIAEDGRHLVFDRAEGGWTAPAGYNLTFTKQPDADPHAVTYTIEKGDGTRLIFDSYGLLTRISDAKGLAVTVAYDADFHMQAVTTQAGRVYAVTTDEYGHITNVTLPNGANLGYTYDEQGFLRTRTDADGAVTRYEYNAQGQMSAWYDGNGRRAVQNVYDAEGRIVGQTDALGGVSSVSYVPGATTLTDASGAVTVYRYDALYQTESITRGGVTEYKSHDTQGRLRSATDGIGRQTLYEYDAAGNLTGLTRSDGSFSRIEYGDLALPVRVRDFDGAETEHVYDAAGNLLRVTYPDQTFLSHTYDAYGRVTSLTDGTGATTLFQYDGSDAMTRIDPLGNAESYWYDAMGRLVAERDATGVERRTSYSPGGRKIGTVTAGDIAVTYEYDEAGNCVSVTDENGTTSRYAYDDANRLTNATAPGGISVSYTYDALGNKTSETDSEGNATRYTYDERGNVRIVRDAKGGLRRSVYDDADRPVLTIDEAGNETAYTYEGALDEPVLIVSPEGERRFSYDPAGRVLSEERPDGTARRCVYDARGRLWEETDRANPTVAYTYDAAGRLTDEADDAGGETHFAYDANGNVTRGTDALGRETRFAYDAVGRPVSVTAPGDLTTLLFYDAAGNVVRIERPDGADERYAYDKKGNLTSVIDAEGNETSYRHDPAGNLAAVVDAEGGTITYAYDGNGSLVLHTGARSEKTAYDYDELNRVIAVTDARGNASRFVYDALGRVTEIVSADGTRTRFEYDAAGRIAEKSDDAGLVTEYEYDARGNLIRTRDNDGLDMTYTYDAYGRALTQTDALSRVATFAYDTRGNLISSVDFNGDKTVFEYDLLGRTTRTRTSAGEDVACAYDLAGNLVSETDALGRATRYEYDKTGNLVKAIDAAGGVRTYERDRTGNVLRLTDEAGNETRASYDKTGRLLSETDGRNNTANYGYDLSGNLVKRTDAAGAVWEYVYDLCENLLREKDPLGNVTTYAYDARNRLEKTTSPRGAVTAQTHDAHSNVTSVADALGNVTAHTYSPSGRLLGTELPSGLIGQYEYDAIGRVTKASDSAGRSVTFSYDRAGNVASQTDEKGARTKFAYDAAHRVTREEDALGGVTTHVYDKAGNLIRSNLPGGATYAYAYDALDRLVTETDGTTLPISFEYDGAGRVTGIVQGEKTERRAFDAAGNPVTYTDALGNDETYTYGKTNLPIARRDKNGNVTQVSYDRTGRLTETRDALGAVRTRTYDTDGILASETDATGNTSSYLYDLAGNPVKVTDPLGRTVEYAYDAMGNVTKARFSDERTAGARALAGMGDGEATQSYTYDAHGNLTSVASPSGAVERFTYDTASLLTSAVSPEGARTDYDYDKLGRLIEKHYDEDGTSVAYAYDSAGRRLFMNDATGRSSYGYDAAGRLASVTQADGRALSYAYDAYGRMSEVGYPDGRTVSYDYDLGDRILRVRDSGSGDTAYAYDAQGNVVSCARPDGTSSICVYDALNRLTRLVNKRGGAVLSSFDYTYDAEGRIVSESVAQMPADGTEPQARTLRAYAYDAAGQLESCVEEAGGVRSKTEYSYDLLGSRVAHITSEDGGEIVCTYDADGRIAERTDGKSGEITRYTWDGDGNLIAKTDGGAGRPAVLTEYAYDAENRLKAVREGGALLMAATYDGDGNRVFQVHRTVTSLPAEDAGSGAEESRSDARSDLALSSPASLGTTPTPEERAFSHRPFLYGFGLCLSTFACAPDMAAAPRAQEAWNGAFAYLLSPGRYDAGGEFGADDLAALIAAGLTEADIRDVTHPKEAPPSPEEAAPVGAASVIIPSNAEPATRFDYELTYYVNDVSYENAQVAMTYGKRAEVTAAYIYGNERIMAVKGSGDADTYLFDGRGSVAQVYTSFAASAEPALTKSYAYDPFGTVTAGAEGDELIWAHNAEEYNPVTALTYLRARYYAPDAASFLTKDTALGSLASINSQNRYAFAESDPINNADPSGHAVSNNAYERQMEAMGGINEIYNFYVGRTLQNAQNKANAAFSSALSRASGTDYTSAEAINAIAGISQATANYYINAGAATARSVGATYGCAPGALTNAAVASFSANVNAAKTSVNARISEVRENKKAQYQTWIEDTLSQTIGEDIGKKIDEYIERVTGESINEETLKNMSESQKKNLLDYVARLLNRYLSNALPYAPDLGIQPDIRVPIAGGGYLYYQTSSSFGENYSGTTVNTTLSRHRLAFDSFTTSTGVGSIKTSISLPGGTVGVSGSGEYGNSFSSAYLGYGILNKTYSAEYSITANYGQNSVSSTLGFQMSGENQHKQGNPGIVLGDVPAPAPVPADASDAPQRDISGYLLGGALIVGGVVIIGATVAEDVLTFGVGIADDPASVAAAVAMFAVARKAFGY